MLITGKYIWYKRMRLQISSANTWKKSSSVFDLYWLPENVTDKIDYATSKFKSYDVILKIKQNFNKREKFSYIDAPVKNHQKYFN